MRIAVDYITVNEFHPNGFVLEQVLDIESNGKPEYEMLRQTELFIRRQGFDMKCDYHHYTKPNGERVNIYTWAQEKAARDAQF